LRNTKKSPYLSTLKDENAPAPPIRSGTLERNKRVAHGIRIRLYGEADRKAMGTGSLRGKTTVRREPRRRVPNRRTIHAKGPGGARRSAGGGPEWLYGRHAVLAALANPERRLCRFLLSHEAAGRLQTAPTAGRSGATVIPPEAPKPEIVERRVIEALLPPQAVHQGFALLAERPGETSLSTVCARAQEVESSRVILLDQVTDPRNIGAVLRTAAAFGALAVIVTSRHAPAATGALAKAASGALEAVPLVRVPNLARAIRELQAAGFQCLGLDAGAAQTLAQVDTGGRIALVLGAEGKGLRRMTRENCDVLLRIPIRKTAASLNVSVAAAIAFYELVRGE
jgi:23S rRNA (guanosine2251-2'-O)-methyltransferase